MSSVHEDAPAGPSLTSPSDGPTHTSPLLVVDPVGSYPTHPIPIPDQDQDHDPILGHTLTTEHHLAHSSSQPGAEFASDHSHPHLVSSATTASVIHLDNDECGHNPHTLLSTTKSTTTSRGQPHQQQQILPDVDHEHLDEEPVVDADGNVKMDDAHDHHLVPPTTDDVPSIDHVVVVLPSSVLPSAIASEAALNQAIGPEQLPSEFPSSQAQTDPVQEIAAPTQILSEPQSSTPELPSARGRISSRSSQQETPERRTLPRILVEQYTSYSEQAGPAGCVEAVCVHCGASIRGQRNVTSNFIQHIRRRHPDAHKIFTARSIRRPTYKKPRLDNAAGQDDSNIWSADSHQPTAGLMDASPHKEVSLSKAPQMSYSDVAGTPSLSQISIMGRGPSPELAVVPTSDVPVLAFAGSSRPWLPPGAPKPFDVLRTALTWPAVDDVSGKFPSPLEKRLFVQKPGLPRKPLLVKREDCLPSGSMLFRAAYAILRPNTPSERSSRSKMESDSMNPGTLVEACPSAQMRDENCLGADSMAVPREPASATTREEGDRTGVGCEGVAFPKPDELATIEESTVAGLDGTTMGSNAGNGTTMRGEGMPRDSLTCGVYAGMPSALSVATAAQIWGRSCTVALPRGSAGRLIGEIEDAGGRVVLCEALSERGSRDAARRAARVGQCHYVDVYDSVPSGQGLPGSGMTVVGGGGSPWDMRIVAAYGTIGLEILRQAPGVSAVYVSGGCAGLFAGLACVFGAVRPGVVRLIGVEEVAADEGSEKVEEEDKKKRRKRKRKSMGVFADEEVEYEEMVAECEAAADEDVVVDGGGGGGLDGRSGSPRAKSETKEERGWRAYAGQVVGVTRQEAEAAVGKVYDACEGAVLDPAGVLSIAGALKHEPAASVGDVVCIVGERLWDFGRLSKLCGGGGRGGLGRPGEVVDKLAQGAGMEVEDVVPKVE